MPHTLSRASQILDYLRGKRPAFENPYVGPPVPPGPALPPGLRFPNPVPTPRPPGPIAPPLPSWHPDAISPINRFGQRLIPARNPLSTEEQRAGFNQSRTEAGLPALQSGETGVPGLEFRGPEDFPPALPNIDPPTFLYDDLFQRVNPPMGSPPPPSPQLPPGLPPLGGGPPRRPRGRGPVF